MRIRSVVLVLALGVGLAGCGDDSTNASASSSPSTESSAATEAPVDLPTDAVVDIGPECAKFANTSKELSEASAKIYTGTTADVEAAVKALQAQLNVLKDGAPGDVKSAIDDLIDGYEVIAGLRANPTSAQSAQELAKLGPQLSSSSQKVAAYITSICTR